MTPLNTRDAQIADTAARVIVQALETGRTDTPEELVPPQAIQFLARAHLELTSKVEQIRQKVSDLDGVLEGVVDQAVRSAIAATLGEVARQQGGIATQQIVDDATTAGLLAAKPFTLAAHFSRVESTPGAATKLRVVRTPAEIAKLSSAELLALYCRVMNEPESGFIQYETYVVRVWDGMDGCWTDCTSAVARETALRYWAARTDGGTHHVAFAEIDYYRIFPGGTGMSWDGSPGREMFR